MKQWFTVDQASGRIKGFTRSGKATEIPVPRPGVQHVECTDAQIEEWSNKQAEMRGDGQSGVVKLEGGVLVKEEDKRPVIRITADKPEVQVGELVTVTFEILDGVGGSRTGFNGVRKVDLLGRRFKLNFTAGVATKSWRPSQSMLLEIHSDNQIKLDSPFTLDVVE